MFEFVIIVTLIQKKTPNADKRLLYGLKSIKKNKVLKAIKYTD